MVATYNDLLSVKCQKAFASGIRLQYMFGMVFLRTQLYFEATLRKQNSKYMSNITKGSQIYSFTLTHASQIGVSKKRTGWLRYGRLACMEKL